MESQLPHQIGVWKVLNQLGQGSFGDVYVAEHPDTKVKAAIKVIDTCKWEENSKQRRTKLLKREIRFSRLLYHPNIIKMIDTMVDGTKVILVLEHIPGGDLEMYIEGKAKRRLNENKARDIFRQTVSGIDYLHKNSIIHRDIKPANIMLDSTHSIPKLIDFGFTTAYDQDKAMYSFLGSPHYAAPELLQGIKYDGPKVDIWSLGVTLYTMLTGQLPFQAKNMEALLNLIVNAKFDIPDHVPPGPKDLMLRMLVVDMEKRISMEEVRQHFWINEGHSEPPEDLAIARDGAITEIDEEVFVALKDFEFKDADINRQALAAQQPSKIKNVYCLLLEARNRADAEREESRLRKLEKEKLEKEKLEKSAPSENNNHDNNSSNVQSKPSHSNGAESKPPKSGKTPLSKIINSLFSNKNKSKKDK